MRLRSTLLCGCMIIVPMLAMFSHHLPPDLARKTGELLRDPVASWTRSTKAESPSPPAPIPTAPGAPAENRPQQHDVPSTMSPVVLAGSPTPPTAIRPAAAPAPFPPRPAAGDASARQPIEASLAKLGATSIGCQPLPGTEGLYLGSCHVAVDAAGELQRVFQATGRSPEMAIQSLLDDVTAWRQRTAVRPPPGGRTIEGDGSRTLRF
jgi:hypothetical protein